MDGHNRKRIRTSTHNVDAPRKHIALDFRDETTLENTKKRRRIEQDGRAQSQSQSPFPKSPMRERSTNLISPSLHSPIDAPAISPHNLQIGLDLPHSTPDSRSDTPQSSAGPVAPSTIHFVPSLNTSTPAVNSPSQAAAVPQVSPHLARNRNSLHASTMTRVVRAQPTHAFSTPLSNNSVDAAIERSSSDEEDNVCCMMANAAPEANKSWNRLTIRP
ncbi:hypothetical protein R3P38DRAFT_3196755 [Favolaschia claudopus]|uniref:Uncharacterized protein n=1 Tax=Favolaschia claudopus TaxID=2862362 RepID=A0AAW0B690_9AGAR